MPPWMPPAATSGSVKCGFASDIASHQLRMVGTFTGSRAMLGAAGSSDLLAQRRQEGGLVGLGGVLCRCGLAHAVPPRGSDLLAATLVSVADI